MDFELILVVIQTITGILSLYLGYKALDFNNQANKNSNNNYTNFGNHTQVNNEINIKIGKEISEKKRKIYQLFSLDF